MTLLNTNCCSGSNGFTFFFIILITRTPTCTPQTTSFSRILCNSAYISPELAAFLVAFNATVADLRASISFPAATGFATVQLVRTRAPIHVLFHCRSYALGSDCLACLACLDTVFALSRANCNLLHRPTIFNDRGYLRYAAINLFDEVLSSGQSGFCDNPTSSERQVGFNETASEELVEVEREVVGRNGTLVAGRKGTASVGVCCGGVLAGVGNRDYQSCLELALRKVRTCLPEAGGKAVESGCFMKLTG